MKRRTKIKLVLSIITGISFTEMFLIEPARQRVLEHVFKQDTNYLSLMQWELLVFWPITILLAFVLIHILEIILKWMISEG